jgi:electron transfer flavoprotein beta subunit
LGGVTAPCVKLDRIYMPERTKKSQVFEGAPKEAAAQLVEKLKFEARVL